MRKHIALTIVLAFLLVALSAGSGQAASISRSLSGVVSNAPGLRWHAVIAGPRGVTDLAIADVWTCWTVHRFDKRCPARRVWDVSTGVTLRNNGRRRLSNVYVELMFQSSSGGMAPKRYTPRWTHITINGGATIRLRRTFRNLICAAYGPAGECWPGGRNLCKGAARCWGIDERASMGCITCPLEQGAVALPPAGWRDCNSDDDEYWEDIRNPPCVPLCRTR